MSVHCDYLTQRNGVWHYYRRVPSEYNTLDLRHHVRLSTKIKVANDRTGTKAGRVAAKLNAAQEAYWRSLSDGKAADSKQSYTDAVKLARSLGLDYLAPSDAAQRPINELLRRIQKTALSKMSADQVRKWTNTLKYQRATATWLCPMFERRVNTPEHETAFASLVWNEIRQPSALSDSRRAEGVNSTSFARSFPPRAQSPRSAELTGRATAVDFW